MADEDAGCLLYFIILHGFLQISPPSDMIPVSTLPMTSLLLPPFLFFLTAAATPTSGPWPLNCSHTCGGRPPPKFEINYPFGFSPGCPIQLNCTSDGNPAIGDFPLRSISSDSITVTILAACDRPLLSMAQLYGPHFAPTAKNAVLLNNCSQPSSCRLPLTMVMTHFDSMCKSSTNVSCYSEKGGDFLNYDKLFQTQCGILLSSIWAESTTNQSVSLDVQIIQLGWWVIGDGEGRCSVHAERIPVPAVPGGGKGYRCRCREGFIGDGFVDGSGCRRGSMDCNPARYLSGECGGITRIIVLIGGVVVGACMMIGLGVITCLVRRRYKAKLRLSAKRRVTEATGQSTIPVYSFREIERATNYFCDKQRLGTGAYGTVYAGKLQDDEWVAIKRIKRWDSVEQVMNEIKLLSSISHPNLVRLLGCSIDKGEHVLVFEYMPNGTLSQHLQRERGEGLEWPVRLAIAAETARAIAHLHSSNPPIYHRDVKSSNILLDYNFKSKVADFGLSRLGMPENSHISTAPQGTPGYLDPQYHQDFRLSDKSDVYSFGVVLAEIITSLKAVDFNRPQGEVNLANLAVDRIGRGILDEIIDPFLDSEKNEWTWSSICKVAELAFCCLSFHRDLRPSMQEVADELEQIRVSGRGTSTSGRSSLTPKTTTNPKAESVSSCDTRKPMKEIISLNSNDSVITDNIAESLRDSWTSTGSSRSSNGLVTNMIQ